MMNKEQMLLYACIHNVSMLSLMISTDKNVGSLQDYDFLGVDNKYPFPNTLPNHLLGILKQQLGDVLTIVPLDEGSGSKLVLPPGFGEGLLN